LGLVADVANDMEKLQTSLQHRVGLSLTHVIGLHRQDPSHDLYTLH